MAIDVFTDLIIRQLGNDPDSEYFDDAINAAERMHVMLIVGFVVETLGKHKDHDNCFAMEGLPKYIQECKNDFIAQLDRHIELNLAVNGLSMVKTHNQQVTEDILKETDNVRTDASDSNVHRRKPRSGD